GAGRPGRCRSSTEARYRPTARRGRDGRGASRRGRCGGGRSSWSSLKNHLPAAKEALSTAREDAAMSSSPRAHSRIQCLRAQRLLEDTAIAAAGGGHLASLAPDNDNPERWRAEVLTGARGRLV